MVRSERVTGNHLQNFRIDRAGEHRDTSMGQLQVIDGLNLEWSPSYASQSKSVADRFIQELATGARVLFNDSHLQEDLLY